MKHQKTDKNTFVATGIVRRIDDSGTIAIPKEIRRKLEMTEGVPVEFYMNDSGDIVLKKYEP